MVGQFRTKHQAQNLRKHSWACTQCWFSTTTKTHHCPTCGTKTQYFGSKDELKRFNQLRLLQQAGKIEFLRWQVPYPVSINGILVFTYKADFVYTNTKDGKEIIEDVKGTTNEKYLDPVFKIKRKCVEAFFGIKISLVKV